VNGAATAPTDPDPPRRAPATPSATPAQPRPASSCPGLPRPGRVARFTALAGGSGTAIGRGHGVQSSSAGTRKVPGGGRMPSCVDADVVSQECVAKG
jgi:hypothetical protein